jgi:hypothetical protein
LPRPTTVAQLTDTLRRNVASLEAARKGQQRDPGLPVRGCALSDSRPMAWLRGSSMSSQQLRPPRRSCALRAQNSLPPAFTKARAPTGKAKSTNQSKSRPHKKTLDMNSNQVAKLPNDSPAMRTTLQTLRQQRIYYERKSQSELRVRNLSFYPDRGYIYPDGARLPLPKPHRGLRALLQLVREPHQRRTFISPAPPASTIGPDSHASSWSVPPAIA